MPSQFHDSCRSCCNCRRSLLECSQQLQQVPLAGGVAGTHCGIQHWEHTGRKRQELPQAAGAVTLCRTAACAWWCCHVSKALHISCQAAQQRSGEGGLLPPLGAKRGKGAAQGRPAQGAEQATRGKVSVDLG
jgi:hypothetical protein